MSEKFVRSEPEHLAGSRIDKSDASVRVGAEDTLCSEVEDEPRALFTGLHQLSLGHQLVLLGQQFLLLSEQLFLGLGEFLRLLL